MRSPQFLTAVAVALIGLLAFLTIERSAPAPLLPRSIYQDRPFIAAVLQGGLFNFAFYGQLFALSPLLQQGRDLSPLMSGLLFLPLTGVVFLATICAAPLAHRPGRPTVSVIAQTSLTTSLLLIAWASTAAPLWPLVLALIPAGFSGGLLVPTLTSDAISAVDPRLHGAASAAFNTARQVGGAIGVATIGPLLGSDSLSGGFIRCLLACAAAAATATIIASATRLHRASGPHRGDGCARRQPLTRFAPRRGRSAVGRSPSEP